MINPRKVAVVGCGFVGSSIAFSLMQRGLFSELVLIDANQAKAEGEAMDLGHGLPYTAAWKLMNDRTPLLDGAQAAAELKRMFLHAYQDSDFPAFTDAQRAALDRQPWPENAYEAAAIIAAALVGFALEEGSLFDTTGRMLRRELGRQTAYLERLQDWAS